MREKIISRLSKSEEVNVNSIEWSQFSRQLQLKYPHPR